MPAQQEGDPGRPVAIGIDQSYTGFAITVLSQDGKSYQSVCEKLRGEGVKRLQHAQVFVGCILEAYIGHTIDIAMEGYAYGATQTAHMAGELGAAVKLTLDEWNHTPLIVPPTQVKKYATGKGNAKKNEMLLHVYKQWGVEFTNDNMADSYVLAQIARGEGRNETQRAVVEMVRKAREGSNGHPTGR